MLRQASFALIVMTGEDATESGRPAAGRAGWVHITSARDRGGDRRAGGGGRVRNGRKVLPPNNFVHLTNVETRLSAFEHRYNAAAEPFDWTITRTDLDALLKRLATQCGRSIRPRATNAAPTCSPGLLHLACALICTGKLKLLCNDL
jgi:hypothetical protein